MPVGPVLSGRWDVLVVGGGPAGLAVALELRRRGVLSVAVVERSAYGAPRIGETLSPGARALLVHLGVWAAFEADGHLPAYGTAAAWSGPDLVERDFLLTPHGGGWNLDRQRFDAGLASAAEARGAPVWRRSRLLRVEQDDGWQVLVDHDGTAEVHRARFLVDATGRTAGVARRLGAERRRLDRQVAVVAPIVCDEAPAGRDRTHHTVVEACEVGWWYGVRLPRAPRGAEGREPGPELMAALITDPDLVRAHRLARPAVWSGLLHGTRHVGALAREGRPAAPPRVVAAHSAWLPRVAAPGWLAVGDAAASHDPLSASGILRALDSAVHAAHAIHSALVDGRMEPLAEYEARQAQAYRQYAETRARYYQLEQRWPDALFWRRRQRSVTLDPRAWVRRTSRRAGEPAPRLPADLGPLPAAWLLDLCDRPRPAHEVVAEHRRRFPAAGDLEVVLALQWLLQWGALEIVAAGTQAPRERAHVP
ncbi:MAG TPA: NAD(P)/FAD-dependent oxidoreductase [Candidatus Dormibacteraeota bacterium]|nr:NAD(P)/FAD-dependent oxidoreductase [Candidatus Dormibacteraeota bacterium]